MTERSSGSTALDPFVLDRIYADPASAFLHTPLEVRAIKDNALIFLDTNVLLTPYNTGKDSLSVIRDVYRGLAQEQRIFIPERVMQEFEKNVPERIKEIFQRLSRQRDISVPQHRFPLLEGVTEYAALNDAEAALLEQLDAYRKATAALLSIIESWHHNDPVRKMYREVFSAAQKASIAEQSKAELLKDWEYRLAHKIPPGYKDAGKDDTGIGDYLVWRTIVETCKAAKQHAVFVCGEEKPDWWHRSERQPLYVRRELVEEFRHATDGKTFSIVSFSQFLEIFGASKSVVREVEQEQLLARAASVEWSDFRAASYEAVENWLHEALQFDLVEEVPSSKYIDYIGHRSSSDDYSLAVWVRPIRHTTHVMRRVNEAVAIATPKAAREFAVIFVAETLASGELAAQILRAGVTPDTGIQVVLGYLDRRARFRVLYSTMQFDDFPPD